MPKEVIHTDKRKTKLGEEVVQVTWGPDSLTAASVELWVINWGRSGDYATLDRQQINRLIQVLRRARDVAYGRDA